MWNLIPWKKNQPSNMGGTLTAEPFEREFARIRDDFDHLLQRMWSGWGIDDRWLNRFGMDVEETDTHYVAHMDAPGFEVDDFDVSVTGTHVLVKAERKESHKGKNGSSTRYGRFERTFALPEGVDADQIEAHYHSGVLELKFPKGKHAENAKRITVKAA